MLALTLAVAGCGISTTGATDEGDGVTIGTGPTDSEVLSPPSPDTAGSPERSVLDFLAAASGGPTQVKAFFTENGLKTWKDPVNKDNPPLTIVRLIGQPQTGAIGARTPITVTYQVVGTLTDKGRVEDLAEPNQHQMVFWVVPDAAKRASLRIDEIAGDVPDGLMLSDKALTDFYRIQPIYFWDQSDSALVPDLRYLPLTITPDLRANRVLQYLAAQPSPWLTGAKALPLGATPTEPPVTSPNGTLVVKFTAQAAPGGEDGLKRLLYQLQWSLTTPNRTPPIALQIDDKIANVNVGATDFQPYNLSSTFSGSAQRYDITPEQKVVTIPASNAQGVLAAPENQNVVSAAISRRGDVAAFVRTDQGSRKLQIVHANGSKIDTGLRSNSMGRPAFTSSNGDLLVTANGRLYAVNATDGSYTEALKGVSGFSAVSVSPDARRVAYVANGQVFVSSLNGTTVGSHPRQILSGQFNATSVAWTNESWLIVGGTGALWRVTADGVLTDDQSSKVPGLAINELLAYPQWPARSNPDSMALVTGRGSYSVSAFSPLQQETYNAPFFGS
jgi:hypothetical protein